MIPLAARAGFRWMATDELIWRARSASCSAAIIADSSSSLNTSNPVQGDAGGAPIACMFRDHALSDLIGFILRRVGG